MSRHITSQSLFHCSKQTWPPWTPSPSTTNTPVITYSNVPLFPIRYVCLSPFINPLVLVPCACTLWSVMLLSHLLLFCDIPINLCLFFGLFLHFAHVPVLSLPNFNGCSNAFAYPYFCDVFILKLAFTSNPLSPLLWHKNITIYCKMIHHVFAMALGCWSKDNQA